MQAQIVILINCGAQLDLVTDLNLDAASGTKLIVADSHRCAMLTPQHVIPAPSADSGTSRQWPSLTLYMPAYSAAYAVSQKGTTADGAVHGPEAVDP